MGSIIEKCAKDLRRSENQLGIHPYPVIRGVESIQNYVFFNGKGLPEQSSKNIQVVSARIKQDIMYRAFGWENEVAYQLSSEKSQLPLPDISAY